MKKMFVKIFSSASIAIFINGCTPSPTETILVCEGDAVSLIGGLGGKERSTYEITKTGDKVVKVKSEYRTFTPEKVDVRKPENKGPVYVQLIADPDKLTLVTEVTEDKRTYETVIFNTGKYKVNRLFGWSEGQCSAGKKAF